jgi:hypothetical protein
MCCPRPILLFPFRFIRHEGASADSIKPKISHGPSVSRSSRHCGAFVERRRKRICRRANAMAMSETHLPPEEILDR